MAAVPEAVAWPAEMFANVPNEDKQPVEPLPEREPEQPYQWPAVMTPAAPGDSAKGAGRPAVLEMDKPFLERGWNAITGLFSGEHETEHADLPELGGGGVLGLGPLDAKSMDLTLKYLTSTDTQAIAQGAKRILGRGANLTYDSFGNPIITYGGKSAYVNKPGFTGADVMEQLGLLGELQLAVRGANRVTPFNNRGAVPTTLRGGAMGLGGAALSVGRDIVGGNPIDWSRAAETAGGMGLSEMALGAVQTMGQKVSDTMRYLTGGGAASTGTILNTTGRAMQDLQPLGPGLTRTADQAIRRMGYDPADFTIGDGRRWEQSFSSGAAARRGLDNPTVSRNTLLSSEARLPITPGQATENPNLLGREDRARGGTAATTAPQWQQLGREQALATQARGNQLINQTDQGISENEVAAAMTQRLKDRLDANRDLTTLAYKMPGAGLTGVGMKDAGNPEVLRYRAGPAANDIVNGVKGIRRDYTPLPGSRAEAAMNEIGDVLSVDGRDAVSAMNTPLGRTTMPGQLREFDQGELNDLRRRLGRLANAAGDDGERQAIRGMIEVVDNAADSAATAGDVIGNPRLLAEAKVARQFAREQLAFARPDPERTPFASAFMEKVQRGTVEPQEVLDGLFGGGALGARPGTVEVLRHLRTQFKADDPIWDQIKQLTAKQLIQGRGTVRPIDTESPLGVKDPQMFANNVARNISRGLRGGEGENIINEVFTPAERRQFERYRDTMYIQSQANAKNTSGSAYSLLDAVRSAEGLPFIKNVLAKEFRDQMLARRSMGEGRQPGEPIPLGVRPEPLLHGEAGSFRRRIAPTVGGLLGENEVTRPAAESVLRTARDPVGTARSLQNLLARLPRADERDLWGAVP